MDWSPHRRRPGSDDTRGATPVVATVLLLGLVVVISASVGTVVLDYPREVTPTSVAADGDCQSVEFDPRDVDEFADEHADCTAGDGTGSSEADGPYQGAVMWFDASQEGFPSGGESVDRWTDRSGNGYDAVVSRGNPQGYADVGGVPAVAFDSPFFAPGGDALTAEATTAEAGVDGDTELTVSVVIRPDGSIGNYMSVGNYTNGTLTGQVNDFVGTREWTAVNTTDGGDGTTTVPVSDTDPWNVVTYTYNRTSASLYVNGEQREQDRHDDIELDMHGDITVGGSPSGVFPEFDGAIAEFVVYDRALDGDQRERLECGFDDKYGSAVTVTGC